MEDLDSVPSKFHELNNAIHAVAVTTAVIKTNIDSQREQAGRIEIAISSVNGRLDRFDDRMTAIEKAQLVSRSEIEKEISDVKANVRVQIGEVTSELKEQMALLSPVKLLVYGAVTLMLTALVNVWVTRTMITNAAPVSIGVPDGSR